jgi:hypothetical protein
MLCPRKLLEYGEQKTFVSKCTRAIRKVTYSELLTKQAMRK